MRTTFSSARRPLLAVAAVFMLGACEVAEKATASNTLTPARNLKGTWKTSFPVTFNYQTDFCAGKETVAAADWNVTWVITPVTGNENEVDIQMTYSSANYRRVASSCGNFSTGYVPLVSPQFLRATLSSTSISINKPSDGLTYNGSFTTDLMEGTWVHWECIIYCTGEFTGTNQLKMMRQ
ncbi:MAG: hypothetical protein WC700_01185 [Gemmatimonadaceae bacterium]|jgi:hypothetical protein